MEIKSCDKVEIVTFQDNYIEITAMDNTAVVQRASLFSKDLKRTQSILAEHGFSAMVRMYDGERTASFLFDFGFSEDGAARNADILEADLGSIQAVVLSHGHMDHTGGLRAFGERIPADRKPIDFIAHPMVFATPRYLKLGPELQLPFPTFRREDVREAGFRPVETVSPYLFADGYALFLGEIPRVTDFEKGFPIAYRQREGREEWDPIEDDSAVVMHLKGKGLVVLTGCAHSGVINTVHHAIETTGIDNVHVIMGGFHLSGPLFEPIINRTTEELKRFDPSYVVPCHCTGRKAVMHIEREMPGRFLLNMAGTKLTFAAAS